DADGQTVEVPVTLIGLGTVTGSVFSNDGTRTLGGIDVELAPSGNFSDRLVTRTDPAGSYVLSGVPLGVYTVRARDFQSGLTGEESGVLRRDGEIATTDVRLEPSGGITGRVYAAGVRLDADGPPPDANGQPWPDAPAGVGATGQIRRRPSAATGPGGPAASAAARGFLGGG